MFPGYKHVREFGPAEDYEDEEEVCYVTLDLGHDVDKALVPNATEYRLAGLDTETPMLQLHGSFFIGKHEELLGTELLFTEGRDETNPSRRFVVPFDMTEQRIQFRQVEVKPKVEPLEDSDPGPSSNVKTASKAKSSKRSAKAKPKPKKSEKAKGKEPVREIVEEDKGENEDQNENEMAEDLMDIE